jgi:hypothetical protein
VLFADVEMVTLLVICVVLQPLSLQNVPIESLVLRATDSVLAGFDGLPSESCDCTVISEEQAPAVMLTGDVVNANFVAVPAEMVMEGSVVEVSDPDVAFKV